MSSLTHITFDDLDEVWRFEDETPYPEGGEIDLDAVGREDMNEEGFNEEKFSGEFAELFGR